MTREARPYHIGVPCHLISRGIAKQPIFLDEQDHRAFMVRMIRFARETKTEIMAFCLMCNHYHLLARRCVGTLDGFTRPLHTSYAHYFNAKYGRVGYVFQNRPKLKRCLNDAYLKTVVRYIHLNPVKAGIVASPDMWPWSSHHSYLQPVAGDFVSAGGVLGVFGGVQQYGDFMGGALLSDFPEEGDFLPSEEDEFELAGPDRAPLDQLEAGVVATIGVAADRLHNLRDLGAAEARFALVAIGLEAGHTRAEIARYLGCSKSAVSMMLRRRSVNCESPSPTGTTPL